jgi:hypothetical protein
VIFANDAWRSLSGRAVEPGSDLAEQFTDPASVRSALVELHTSPHSWRQELELAPPDNAATADARLDVPVAVRVEVVAARNGLRLGYIVAMTDLRDRRRADAARAHLHDSLREAARLTLGDGDDVVSAILTNTSLAALDISEARGGLPVAPLLQELEASTRRAAALYAQIRGRAS